MTDWEGRTLEQQTDYIRKTYARAPVRSLTGRIVHDQTAHDVMFASEQFDAWLARHDAAVRADQQDIDARIAARLHRGRIHGIVDQAYSGNVSEAIRGQLPQGAPGADS